MILQLKLKKTGFSIFSKNTKKSKFHVELLIFVNARSQSSVVVESSRGTQNARNKPNNFRHIVPIAKIYFSVGFRGEIRKVCFEIGTKFEIWHVRYLLETG